MQKLFNVMAAASFVMSGAMVAGTVVFYTRIPSLTKHYMNELKLELTKMLPSQVDDVIPELPTETGLPIKFP